MPTDESIAAIYKRLSDYCQMDRSISQWGDAPVWNEPTYVYRFSNLLGLVTHTFCPITQRVASPTKAAILDTCLVWLLFI